MPIVGGHLGRHTTGHLGCFEVSDGYIEQGPHSSKQVKCMSAREDVKEAAGRIGSKINTLRCKLSPGYHLASEKKNSQDCGKISIPFKPGKILRHKTLERP